MNLRHALPMLCATVPALLVASPSFAQTYNAVVNSGDLKYVTGSYTEISNTDGLENTTSSTCKTVGTGAANAEIFMTNWYAEPITINTAVNPSLIEMKLVKDSYNSTTGSFCWHTVSWLKQAMHNDTFQYGYYFVIVLADNTNASVRAKTYDCAGSNGWSNGTCQDDFSAASAGLSGKYFVGYGIKSFTAETESGAGINLNELQIDFSGGSMSGTTFTATAPLNKFMGSTATNTAIDIHAEVVFVTATSGTSFPAGAAFQRNRTLATQGSAYQATSTYGAKPTGMDGSFAGLETIDLHLASGVGDTVTHLDCGVFGVGDDGTNLTANIGADFGNTGGNLYGFNTNFFHLVTK